MLYSAPMGLFESLPVVNPGLRPGLPYGRPCGPAKMGVAPGWIWLPLRGI